MNKISFDGQVAIVTGAGGGLGREYALELARRGARVVVNDLGVSSDGKNPTSIMADNVVAEIGELGGQTVADYNDVSTRAGGEALVRTAIERFGRLDAVIINAGRIRPARFEDQTDERIDLVLNVNLKQGYFVGQPAYRVMKQQQYGRFVFMASSVGLFGDAWAANYEASKAGLFAISNVIAIEGARHGIRSNVLLPNARSRMEDQIDHAFMQEVEEIGATAAGIDFTVLQDQFTPIFNAPIAVFLASAACGSSHGVFSSMAGRYARVSIGVGKGWRAEAGRLASVDEIAEHWEQIEDDKIIDRPQFPYDEMRILSEQLQAV